MRESEFSRDRGSFFVVFLLCTPVLFSGIRKFLTEPQISNWAPWKMILKSDFFFKRNENFSLYYYYFRRRFSERFTNYYIIDIDPSFQFVVRDDTCVLIFVLLEPREEDCSKRSTEVIIIISKPRRRLTHTWNPFFSLGMRKDNVHYLFTNTNANERRVNRSTALKDPHFVQRLASSVSVNLSCSSASFFCIFL